MAEGGDISSFLSSSPLHVDCSSTFTRFLSFKLAKRRFIRSGSVEELSRFIEVKFAMVNDCNGGGFVKLSTNSCAVFKLPFNFSLLLCKRNLFLWWQVVHYNTSASSVSTTKSSIHPSAKTSKTKHSTSPPNMKTLP